jgi:polyvinyl alcohol dehydrogenase (cytochrome)
VQMMAPEMIYRALSVGIMQPQAAGLSDDDKRHVAEYLSGVPFGAPRGPEAPRCAGPAAAFDLRHEPAVYGFGLAEGNTHAVSAAAAGLKGADIPGTVRVRSMPTYAYGALYFGSQNGAVYALDAKTGCVRFTFDNSAEVRTAVVVPPRTGAALKEPPRAYFGDILGRVHAIDATTGREIWRRRLDDHPSATITGSPVYHEGRLYVPVSSLEEAILDASYPCCTFRGSVVALDARTGEQLWKYYTIPGEPKEAGVRKSGAKIYAPSGAAVWNTPTVDAKRRLLYFGTGNNYTGPATSHSNSVVALKLASGERAWSWQVTSGDAWNAGCMVGLDNCPDKPGPDYDIGSGTMLVHTPRGDRLLVGLKSGTAMALDPDTHDKALWSNRVGRGSIQGGIQYGMAYDGTRLYVPISDMADTKDASSKERDAAAGPIRPGLYGLDPLTGTLLWTTPADNVCRGREACDPGILASITAIPGAVFAGHMDGRVRAYDAATGAVLWQFDTSEPRPALGGATATGGTIGGGGPVVYDGRVYTNSGYGLYAHMAGNMLAAFSVDGR